MGMHRLIRWVCYSVRISRSIRLVFICGAFDLLSYTIVGLGTWKHLSTLVSVNLNKYRQNPLSIFTCILMKLKVNTRRKPANQSVR